MATAWIFGGTGAVGGAVVRELGRVGLECVFTFHANEAGARALEAATAASARRFDAGRTEDVQAWVDELIRASGFPRAVVYAIGVSQRTGLAELEQATWDEAMRVNVTTPFLLVQALAARKPTQEAPLDVVLVGALDRGQSLPLPVHFAATQGALSAMTMAIAHEVGRANIRVNQLALGVLERGLSRVLEPSVIEGYLKFSALRRRGTAEEVARAVRWLAVENTYMTGRVVPLNGGI